MTGARDLGPLPKRHVRAKVVDDAEMLLDRAYHAIREDSELTTGEQVRVLSNFLATQLGSIAKYAIRHERHGSGDKPGDVE